MGLTAVVSSAASSSSASSTSSAVTSVASLLTPVGLGVGGAFVAAALLLLLTYFDVFSAAEGDDETVRLTLVATIIPLTVTFIGILTFRSLAFF